MNIVYWSKLFVLQPHTCLNRIIQYVLHSEAIRLQNINSDYNRRRFFLQAVLRSRDSLYITGSENTCNTLESDQSDGNKVNGPAPRNHSNHTRCLLNVQSGPSRVAPLNEIYYNY